MDHFTTAQGTRFFSAVSDHQASFLDLGGLLGSLVPFQTDGAKYLSTLQLTELVSLSWSVELPRLRENTTTTNNNDNNNNDNNDTHIK